MGAAKADYDLIKLSATRTYAELIMQSLDAFNNSTNIVNG